MAITRITTVISLLAALPLAAALAAQTYPHAFPRTGVTKLFENERVIVWDVKWLRDVTQPYHRHQYDMARRMIRSTLISTGSDSREAASNGSRIQGCVKNFNGGRSRKR